MADTLEDLHRRMDAAAAAEDFEEAARLRDEISLLRASPSPGDPADIDPSGLTRQQPGRMGLGTSQQQVTPPPGWRPPARPDPMTSGRARPRGRRRPGRS